GREILDVFVPSGTATSFTGGLGYPQLWEGTPNLITKNTCLGLTEYMTVYRRSIFQTAFSVFKTGVFKGSWTEGPTTPNCGLTQTSGDVPSSMSGSFATYHGSVTSGMFGAATYRIAVATRKTGLYGSQVALPVSIWVASGSP